MQFHRAVRNGESHSESSGVGASRVINPVEGKEDGVEIVRWNARAMIAHIQYGHQAPLLQPGDKPDLHLGTYLGVSNGIAHDIFDGPVL